MHTLCGSDTSWMIGLALVPYVKAFHPNELGLVNEGTMLAKVITNLDWSHLAPKTVPTTVPTTLAPPVTAVSFDARVLQAQIYMNIIGFTTHLDEDGLAGPATTGAIRQFQSLAGLPVTGLLDTATYNALASTAASITPRPPPPPAGSGFLTGTWTGPGFTLVFGSGGNGTLTLNSYQCTASVTQISFDGTIAKMRYVVTSNPLHAGCTPAGTITSTRTSPTTSVWTFVGDDGSTTSGTATLTPPSTPVGPVFQTGTWTGPGVTEVFGSAGCGIVTLTALQCTATTTQISFDGITAVSRYVLTANPLGNNCFSAGVITSTRTSPTTANWTFVGDDGSTTSGTVTQVP